MMKSLYEVLGTIFCIINGIPALQVPLAEGVTDHLSEAALDLMRKLMEKVWHTQGGWYAVCPNVWGGSSNIYMYLREYSDDQTGGWRWKFLVECFPRTCFLVR